MLRPLVIAICLLMRSMQQSIQLLLEGGLPILQVFTSSVSLCRLPGRKSLRVQLWTWVAKMMALQIATRPQGEWVRSQTARTGVLCLWVAANPVLCQLITGLPIALSRGLSLQDSCLCAPPYLSQKHAISLL